jgi:hypothetical protein
LVVLALLCWSACARPRGSAAARAEVRAWPEGSALFRSQPAWAGGDSAYSVELGPRRVLWLFGDTFLDPAADGSRTNGPNQFLRNSVAIQQDAVASHDLSRAAIEFFSGPLVDGVPRSFFHDVDGAERWVWPFAGVRLASGPLLLFRMQVEKVSGGLGFAVSGWDAIAVDDPEPPPSAWSMRVVQPLTREPALLVGAAVLLHDGYLYAYAPRNDDRTHAVHLARWPLARLGRVPAGSLADPEWFTAQGFVAQSRGAQPSALFADGQTELSVHYDRERARFVEVQMRGLMLSDPRTALAYRTAQHPEGPWSELIALWRPPQAERSDAQHLVAYAAKAHPEQAGPQLVVSYVVHDLKTLVPADPLYFPELVRVQLP